MGTQKKKKQVLCSAVSLFQHVCILYSILTGLVTHRVFVPACLYPTLLLFYILAGFLFRCVCVRACSYSTVFVFADLVFHCVCVRSEEGISLPCLCYTTGSYICFTVFVSQSSYLLVFNAQPYGAIISRRIFTEEAMF